MAWIYFQASVESESLSSHGSEQSPIVSVIDTLKASYCPVCDHVKLIQLRSGTMSQLSEEICCQGSTSSSEDSLVRISALQAVERAWMESEVVFSSRSPDLSESVNLDLFSWKTSLPSEPVEEKEWLKNWPRSGMTVDGQLFRPPQLEPHTKETGGFYWPTPSASSYGSNKGGASGRAGKDRPSLETMARKNLWPTPRASDQNGPAWRTNQAKGDNLPKAVQRQSSTGQLSPMWVEWLMGYKIGWTELDALATQWFHSKSERRSKSSQG